MGKKTNLRMCEKPASQKFLFDFLSLIQFYGISNIGEAKQPCSYSQSRMSDIIKGWLVLASHCLGFLSLSVKFI